MDSGNSSSMQSSSGGDDQELDSRTFLQPPGPPPHRLPQQPPPPPQQPFPIFQDPNFLPQFSDRDLFAWPPPQIRPDPVNNYLSFAESSSAAAAPLQAPAHQAAAATKAGPSKNPKKRTRASRRAPTTVLTTDTTNFRAMVQEFTGIPDPPFSAAASAYSRRLDLLGTAGASMRLAAAGFGGGGPLRPTAQRRPPLLSAGFIGSGQMGQPDPILAFLQQPNQHQYQQQQHQHQQSLLSNSNVAFGVNNLGLLEGLSNNPSLINSQGIGLESDTSFLQHNNNNNYDNSFGMMSCGATTSSSSTDVIRSQGEYRKE